MKKWFVRRMHRLAAYLAGRLGLVLTNPTLLQMAIDRADALENYAWISGALNSPRRVRAQHRVAAASSDIYFLLHRARLETQP